MNLSLSPFAVHFRLDHKNSTKIPKFGNITSCRITKVHIFWKKRVWWNLKSPYFLDKAWLTNTRKFPFLSKKISPHSKQTNVCFWLENLILNRKKWWFIIGDFAWKQVWMIRICIYSWNIWHVVSNYLPATPVGFSTALSQSSPFQSGVHWQTAWLTALR